MKEEYRLNQDVSEEPILLPTDPEEVMWNSLLFSSIGTLLGMILTRFL